MLALAAIACFGVACDYAPSSNMESGQSGSKANPRGALVVTDRALYEATVDSEWVRVIIYAALTNRTADTLRVYPCRQRPPYHPVVSLERDNGNTR